MHGVYIPREYCGAGRAFEKDRDSKIIKILYVGHHELNGIFLYISLYNIIVIINWLDMFIS